MNLPRRFGLLALLTTLTVVAHATPAHAFTRKIQVSGTASSAGICQIIIESFGFTKGGGSGPSLAPIVINVPITNGSTAVNSASVIRTNLIAGLPADYVVTLPIGEPGVVRIDRITGTFTMSINDDVAVQNYVEILPIVPGLGAWGQLLLALTLALGGSWMVSRRRRGGTTAG